ncbi:hypothetical protein EMIHUDRAFT_463686 [Emiliania huxleyi CCMP1516]|uniref:Sulfotransferase domain-containing protein n=2 Tax=Emiliania huxleyi TaxID=2903 RepID=A0A0D3JFE7_EMIH1|nr:hypothetical protein EMIHUDRAFT_463686 [Emiliania huxleyi CCMP1516]EOD22232.1 hypothetical protein EMIHUDRAFT_463686 [Emiliania huxleyi CCMP1516]|eukprot:XP_005774661.1 hypothetical protein EMIHUDRAFT_463686 [Emiliania huxleyi CCMP1516]
MASSLGDAGITGTTLEMLAAKKTGPMPCGRSWKGLPVPFFFREDSAEAFKALDMRPDDVVCSSPVKAGTSWLHKILTLLLHGLDDEGRPIPVSSPVVESLLKMQIYPEACPMEPPAEPVPIAGLVSYPLLVGMPAPRLFTTHLFGDLLPARLMEPAGTGRLIVCLRNPKDVLTSLHFFRGEAKDGWRGNEHGLQGPGSLPRFCSPQCPNAYGSVFEWMLATERAIAPLAASGRVLVVYYEDLKLDLEARHDRIARLSRSAQLDRIAAFLGRPLTPAKRAALAEAVSFRSMAGHVTQRKGEVGDWKNHLDDAAWKLVDDTVVETGLAACALYAPLARYARR